MASDNADIRIFEIIGNDAHFAVYGRRGELPLNGRHPKEVVRETVSKGVWPGGDNNVALLPNPDRSLDILEQRSGVCTYLFLLNAMRGDTHRLRFVPGEPFIPLPLNSTSGEQFLTDFETYEGGEGLWASFSCNVDAVHNSELVRRLRAYFEHHGPEKNGGEPVAGHEHDGNGHEHLTALTIPFTFNFVDPETGVAPWIFPRGQETEEGPHLPFFTHGGIHPTTAAFLVLPLEE